MGSIFQGNAHEVVLQIMVMNAITDAHQIVLSQKSCEPDSFLSRRLIDKLCISATELLCEIVKTSGHLWLLATNLGSAFSGTHILEIAVSLVQDKHVEGSEGSLQRHKLSIAKFRPLLDGHASM